MATHDDVQPTCEGTCAGSWGKRQSVTTIKAWLGIISAPYDTTGLQQASTSGSYECNLQLAIVPPLVVLALLWKRHPATPCFWLCSPNPPKKNPCPFVRGPAQPSLGSPEAIREGSLTEQWGTMLDGTCRAQWGEGNGKGGSHAAGRTNPNGRRIAVGDHRVEQVGNGHQQSAHNMNPLLRSHSGCRPAPQPWLGPGAAGSPLPSPTPEAHATAPSPKPSPSA